MFSFRLFDRCLRKNRRSQKNEEQQLLNGDEETIHRIIIDEHGPDHPKKTFEHSPKQAKKASFDKEDEKEIAVSIAVPTQIVQREEKLDFVERIREKYPPAQYRLICVNGKKLLLNLGCFALSAGAFTGSVLMLMQKVNYYDDVISQYMHNSSLLNSSYPNMSCNDVFRPYNLSWYDLCDSAAVKQLLYEKVAVNAIDVCTSLVANICSSNEERMLGLLIAFSVILGTNTCATFICQIINLYYQFPYCRLVQPLSQEEENYRHHIGVKEAGSKEDKMIRQMSSDIRRLSIFNRNSIVLRTIDQYLSEKDKEAKQFIRLSMEDSVLINDLSPRLTI
jgi:hypothetical protein